MARSNFASMRNAADGGGVGVGTGVVSVAGAGSEAGVGVGTGAAGGGFTGAAGAELACAAGCGLLAGAVSVPAALRTAAINGSADCGGCTEPVSMLLKSTMRP